MVQDLEQVKSVGSVGKINARKYLISRSPNFFYNNHALSKSFARHLGRIVRNPRITPMRVKEWSNITDAARKHIFDAIKVCLVKSSSIII